MSKSAEIISSNNKSNSVGNFSKIVKIWTLFFFLQLEKIFIFQLNVSNDNVLTYYNNVLDNNSTKLPLKWIVKGDLQFAYKSLRNFQKFADFNCKNSLKAYKNTLLLISKSYAFCETVKNSGNLSMYVFGNNHAIGFSFLPRNDEKIKKVVYFSGNGCYFSDFDATENCKNNLKAQMDVVKILKPDISFIVFAYFDVLDQFNFPIKIDPNFLRIQNMIKETEKNSKFVVIFEPNIEFKKDSLSFMYKKFNGVALTGTIFKPVSYYKLGIAYSGKLCEDRHVCTVHTRCEYAPQQEIQDTVTN